MQDKNPDALEAKRRGKWLVLLVLMAGMTVLVAIGIGVAISRQRAEEQRVGTEVKRRLDAIRAAGQPLSALDLAKKYPDPPPELDASLLLKPALAMLVVPEESTNLPFFEEFELSLTDPLDQSVIAEARLWLDRNSNALASIPWDKLEGAWIGSGFSNGLTNLTQAPLSKMNRLTRLLCLNSVMQAEFQQPREAMQSLRHVGIICRTLKNDLPIHYMIRDAAERRTCAALERIINRVSIPDADLNSFASFLTLTNLGSTKEALINLRPKGLLRAEILQALTSQMSKGSLSPVRRLLRAYQSRLLYRDADLLQYLDWNDRCLAALDLPMSKAIPILLNMEKDQEDALRNHPVSFWNSFRQDRFSLMTGEEIQSSQFLLPELESVALVRVAVAALAIEHWRSVHDGQIPGSLVEVTSGPMPETFTDPYDGKPLRFKKLSKGYVVYSMKRDLINGGERKAKTTDPQDYDVAFFVER